MVRRAGIDFETTAYEGETALALFIVGENKMTVH